ncbi:MAG TPA: 50S ribosomal protein L23 [Candidatus Nanoarchaeia archaeon]|nr:50S ribosomal protein L23 [Candidatus Nanoarchaeia archaeon]
MDPYDILKFPISTEKAVRQMEMDNKLIFIVASDATKPTIKWAAEKAFNVKVQSVNTMKTRTGEKKAYIKLRPETPAVDVTTALGLT